MNRPFIPTAETLGLIAFFKGLTPEERDSVAGQCSATHVDAHQIILSQRDASEDVYFVVNGQLRAHIFSPSGKEVAFRDVNPGDMFGEIAAIDAKPRSASIVAVENSTLVSMHAQSFRTLVFEHPALTTALLQRWAGLIRNLSDRIVEFSTLPVRNRIHAELLRLASEHVDGKIATLDPAPTHAQIASRISTHREAVTRELSDLARDGLVVRESHRLIIPDIEKLDALVKCGKPL